MHTPLTKHTDDTPTAYAGSTFDPSAINGELNDLQRAVLSRFAEKFAPDAVLVYLSDVADNVLYKNETVISRLGVDLGSPPWPDVVLLDENKQWLYLIDAVPSRGMMTPERVAYLREMFAGGGMKLIFISASSGFDELNSHMKDIAWETEVWLADTPEHMIHFNGDRFFGPR